MPKLTQMQTRLGWIELLFLAASCVILPRTLCAQVNRDNYFPPPDSQGGWRKAADMPGGPAALGIDARKLDEAFEVAQQSTKNGGLVVVHHGWLVYDRYFGKGHQEATCNLASCGKSVTSIAVG